MLNVGNIFIYLDRYLFINIMLFNIIIYLVVLFILYLKQMKYYILLFILITGVDYSAIITV